MQPSNSTVSVLYPDGEEVCKDWVEAMEFADWLVDQVGYYFNSISFA